MRIVALERKVGQIAHVERPLKSLESALGDSTLYQRRRVMLMTSQVDKKQVSVDRPVIKRLCQTLSFGRSIYYQGRRVHLDPDLILWEQIHKLTLFWALRCIKWVTAYQACRQ